jgi:hypothetical protein
MCISRGPKIEYGRDTSVAKGRKIGRERATRLGVVTMNELLSGVNSTKLIGNDVDNPNRFHQLDDRARLNHRT